MIHKIEGAGNVELQSALSAALTAIDDRICTPEAKAKLEVNRKKRKVPHYPFVPSHHHPDPFGVPSYQTARVHKPSGKR